MLTPLQLKEITQTELTRQKDLEYFDYIKQIELASKQGLYVTDVELPSSDWAGFKEYLTDNGYAVTDKLVGSTKAIITVSWQ